MKFKTQKAALCHALLNGQRLSIMDAFKKFGITNLPREIGRSVEREFGVLVSRNEVHTQTKYGTHCSYFEYFMPKPCDSNRHELLFFAMKNHSSKKQKAGIREMLKYVMDNMVKK